VTGAAAGDPQLPLRDTVAIVTGAGGLLGREHAAALWAAGAHVVLADTTSVAGEEAADTMVDGIGALMVAAVDVTNAESLVALRDQVIERFGRIDVLVNNAAINDKVEDWDPAADEPDVMNYPIDAWRHVLDVNVTGVFLSSQIFGASMVGAASGSIINIASTYALVGPDPSLYERPDGRRDFLKSPAYPTSKAAVIGLTRYLATAWGAHGVRVNALAPGGVENGQEPFFVERYASRTPLGRMAAPADYHGAIVFLASDASRYMTGATLVVDGGFTAW